MKILQPKCHVSNLAGQTTPDENSRSDPKPRLETHQRNPFGNVPPLRTKEFTKVTVFFPGKDQPGDPIFNVLHEPSYLHDVGVRQLVQYTQLVDKHLERDVSGTLKCMSG